MSRKNMTGIKLSGRGLWAAIAVSFAAGLLLALAVRYAILENAAQELMCREGGGSGWCTLRARLGWSIYHQLIGLSALGLATVAWLVRVRWVALSGLLLAGCGLLLYNATWAGVAAIIALLAALRPVERIG
ncbi:MAG TPA: hypothetical protein VGE00_07525 [Gammaproteobacteria bacterium]